MFINIGDTDIPIAGVHLKSVVTITVVAPDGVQKGARLGMPTGVDPMMFMETLKPYKMRVITNGELYEDIMPLDTWNLTFQKPGRYTVYANYRGQLSSPYYIRVKK